MLKKTSRYFFRFAGAAVAILIIISTVLVIRERRTLAQLVHPEQTPAGTEVYGRWLDLNPEVPCSWERLTAWLAVLGYRSVNAPPTKPGEYQAGSSDVTAFVRPFRYSDADYPAQLIKISFFHGRLDSIQALAGHVALKSWRLEPPLLAEWETSDKTAKAPVRIAELPPYVPRAILAMEDKRFFEHGAFDPVGIARALWVDLRHAQIRQGASTIHQQLARSIFLDVHRTWRRKILEAALAVYLDLRYSKPQLLEMYLNQVYWGQDGPETLIGIEAASESLFGKPARSLTVAESAILAGMLQSPRRYSPRNASAQSEERKKIVLGLMRDQRMITPDQYQAALTESIHLAPVRKTNDAAYFLAMVHDNLAERYDLPALLAGGCRIFTTLDPLLERQAVQAVKPPVGQAALVALDPKSGAVRAWVGGTNFQTNPFDHAIDAKRQPGSAFKPFIAIAALESRHVTTATVLEDKPITLPGIAGKSWTPQNYDRKYRGKVSVWDAVVDSLNVPIVRLAMQTGLAPIVDVARRAGIQSPLREDLSLALGTSEVSLLELTSAYGTIAAGGQRAAPFFIQALVGEDGRILELPQAIPVQAFDPPITYLVTQMLEAVLQTGTGKASQAYGLAIPAAGKTGTSENFQDAWFIGYTTALTCGVWVGYDKPQSLGHSAAGIALPLWVDFMKNSARYDPPQTFSEPTGVTWKTIDTDSGLLAKMGCPNRRKAAFLPGTEPTQECTLHAGGITGLFQRWRSKI